MIKSMKMMKSRHSETSCHTTSLARRALVLISILMFSLGNIWGQQDGDITLTFNRAGYTDINKVTVNVNGVSGAQATITGSGFPKDLLISGILSNPRILCPNVNGNTNPTITLELNITGLPKGSKFYGTGLHIHALNSAGNYQMPNDGVKRQWNIAVKANDTDDFVTYNNIDIAEGVVNETDEKAHRIWEENGNIIETQEDGTLKLSLTITKGTVNGGCFFGLESIILKKVEDTEDDIQIPFKTKTLLYDDEKKCTPTLLQYWKEVAEDWTASTTWTDDVKLTFNRQNGGSTIASTTVTVSGAGGANATITQTSGFKTWQRGGQITDNILSPNLNIDAPYDPITIQFKINNIPANFQFNTVGLYVHAFNIAGNYQSPNSNKPWNITIGADDDENFASVQNLDITQGGVQMNREIKAAVSKIVDGSLTLSLTIAKALNHDCYFGLESITLSYDEESAGNNNLSNLNVRWYFENEAGEELNEAFDIETPTAYTKGSNDYYKFDGFTSDLFDEDFTYTSLNPTITIPGNYTPENVRLVCALINKPNDATNEDLEWAKKPRNIKMKYVYTLKPQNEIDEIEKGTLAYNPDTKEITPTLLQDWEEVAEDCGVTPNFEQDLYVRWYFEDENGEEVAGTITNGNVFTKTSPNGKHGYYKYSDFTFDGNNENTAYNPTFKIPEGFDNVEIENVRLVCMVTTMTEGYPENYWIGDPAEMQVKYVYNLIEGARIKEKVLTYDEELHTPTLLQYWQEIANDCGISSKEDLADKLYVRWYLEDDKGNELNRNFGLTLNNDFYTEIAGQNSYYKFRGFTNFDEDFKSTIYNPNPTITLPDGQTYDNVRLVCLVTTKTDDYSIGETWSEDPKYMQVKYVYKLNQAIAPKIVPITQVYDKDNKTCTPTLLANLGEVAKDFDVTEAFLKANLYVRWYFEDKEGQALTDDFTIDPDDVYTATPNNNGYYKYGGFEGNTTTTIKIPDDYDLNDVRLVCVATTKTKGYPEDYWIGDPAEMQVKYVYTLYAPIPEKHKVIVYDDRKCSPHLLQFYREIAIDLNKSETDLRNLYVRWYFEDENGRTLTEPFTKEESWGTLYKQAENGRAGYYMNGGFTFGGYGKGFNERFVPTFTMPATWGDLEKVRLVCLVTTEPTGHPEVGNEDLGSIRMRYVYTLMPKNEAANSPFVHYQGESGRPYINYGSRYDNKNWNAEKNTYEPYYGNIRQGVHTWEYDIYIGDDENSVDKKPRDLLLPFQNYLSSGEDKEPRGYFRWYNWDTEKRDDSMFGDALLDGNLAYTFNIPNTMNSKLKKTDYGFIATCLDQSPTSSNIGMTIQKRPYGNDHTPLTIACDVSKYADGMDESYTYLLHEPTLSSRYIFHIRPASELGKDLEQSKTDLAEAEQNGATAFFKAMSNLREDKGKVVVSLEERNTGTFSLRFDQQDYDYYFLKDGDTYKRSTDLRWVVYIEDENGNIQKKDITKDSKKRITNFEYEDFITGFAAGVNAANADRFHVVGYACYGDNSDPVEDSGLYAPVVHYELDFIEAPHIPVEKLMGTDIAEENIIERTDAYMNEHYERAAILDWDGYENKTQNDTLSYYSTKSWDAEPTSSADNMSYVPFRWDDIQYSYCYPTLTHTLNISATAYNLGVSPAHGDYMVLKSMNMRGVSEQRAGTYGQSTLPYEYFWWDNTELHDYTYYATNKEKHGSFLYTDASDESRTIATIPFTADLCSGSYIYFTAAVADMTVEGATPPQLLIRIVDTENNDRRLVAFLSGVMRGEHGKWYQFYGKGTLPSDFESTHGKEHVFKAEIINYANNAYGADFALDQIAIYVKNSKVLLEHEVSVGCDDVEDEKDKEGKVKVYMDSENLQNAFGKGDDKVTIYWRICDENGKVVTGDGMYPRADDEEGNVADSTRTYGTSTVIPNYLGITNIPDKLDEGYGWYKENGTYYFQIAKQVFPSLEAGKKYYVSIYYDADDPSGTRFKENDANNALYWGSAKDGICTIYSEFFFPLSQYVTYQLGDSIGGELERNCDGTIKAPADGVRMILKVGRDKNFTIVSDEAIPPFDYAFYSVKDWNSKEKLGDDTQYTYQNLRDAWLDYRGATSPYNGKNYAAAGLAAAYNTTENADKYNVLEYAIKHDLLVLSNSKNFSDFDKIKTNEVICLPTFQRVEISKDVYVNLCVPFKMTLNLKGSTAPELELGFMDVTYPEDYTRVVRVGLEQLTNMQKDNGYLLHIPVHSFKTDKNAEPNTGALTIISPYLELLKDKTNDPGVTGKVNIATFAEKEINGIEKMFISVNLHETGIDKLTFKEGFTYHLFFQAKKKDYSDKDCEVSVNFLLKVVPEFVTWNDADTDVTTAVTPNINKNTNWNNDENWSRSKRAELHKASSDTPSPGHPDGYKDNATMGITSTPASFVPMKFTYVTIPSGNKAPTLMNLEINATDGIYQNVGEGATDNIQYDMMVRYTEKECLGHDKVGGGKTEPIKDPSTIYDCEKFYGNWAKEIYFKPEAELMYQHYLTYEKVWVEKKLDAGKWTLMSTPLQNTYAGDMYVPFADGQQNTEAFQPIEFKTPTYSRTKYPIYQRSWAQSDSKVYTKTNDVRANLYSANITDGVNENFTQWSHTYNDVQVKYSDWKGFAIRAHKTDYNGTRSANALLRLPKEDTQYDYYQWDGNMPTNGKLGAQAVDKKADNDNNQNHLATGKLFTDQTFNTYGLTYGVKYIKADKTMQDRTATVNGIVEEPVSELQNVDGYLLVGNPYLCSISVTAFFANENNKSVLDNGCWTYEDNNVSAQSTEIKPLQSFFVKLKDKTDAISKIQFTYAMMTDGNTPPAPSRTFALTATNDRGQSVANVSVGEEAKNVETLFDSNLDDVPMVYTVANGQAVSINQVTELSKPIAFGVTCAANDEPVTVTFSDIEQLTNGEVYVVDAVTGEQTAISEGSTLTVQPNDYGRYFLLAGALNIDESVNVQQGIMVSVRGRVVTVTSGEMLTEVRALSPDGATVQQATAGSTRTSLTLATSGVYIIKAKNVAGEQQTVKVMVRTE